MPECLFSEVRSLVYCRVLTTSEVIALTRHGLTEQHGERPSPWHQNCYDLDGLTDTDEHGVS